VVAFEQMAAEASKTLELVVQRLLSRCWASLRMLICAPEVASSPPSAKRESGETQLSGRGYL
jgi:hypothetical protein